MALSTRELYLVLRARDEASRTLRGVSRELMATGAAAAAAASRANAALARQEAARLRNLAAIEREKVEQLRANGATAAQIRLASSAAKEYDKKAKAATAAARAYDEEANAVARASIQQQHRINLLHQAGVALATVGVGMAAAGVITLAALGSMTRASEEYNRQVALTRTQVDGFSVSLKDLSDVGLQVANEVGVQFHEIQAELYDIFSSTNANLEQSKILLNAFARAAVAGQTSMQSATRTTIAIMNAYNIPLEKVNDILDIQFQLVRKGVGTYEEFAAVIGNSIPAATRAGQSFETVAAMLAFMTRNGLSAAMASTSAARALEAMSHPRTVERLKQMGVSFHDAAGRARPLTDVLTDLRKKLEQLPAKERVGALVELFKGAGGTIQARRFLEQVLLRPGDLEELKGFLNDMQNATGAFGDAYNQMADTAAVKTQLLRNRWEALKVNVGNTLTPALLVLVDALSRVLEWFNKLPEGTRKNIVIITALGAALLTVAGVVLVLLGGLATLIAAIASAGTVLFAIIGVTAGVVAGIGGITAAVVALYKNSANFRKWVSDVRGYLGELQEAAEAFGRKVRDAWNNHLAGPLGKLWQVIEGQVIPAFAQWHAFVMSRVLPAIKEAGRILGDIFGKALQIIGSIIQEYVIPAIQRMVQWWNDHKQTLMPLISIMAQVVKWLLIIVGVIVGVLAVALLGPVVAAIMAVVTAFAAIIAIITYVIEWGQKLWGWIKQFVSDTITAFKMLPGQISNVWNTIVNAVGGFLTRINNAVREKFNQARNAAVGAFESLRAAVTGKIDAARNAVSNAINTIRSFFSNAGTWLLEAGRNLIEGLINGIRSKADGLKNIISNLANTVRGAWPFSPAKWGPLSGRGDMARAGANILTNLAKGMLSNVDVVRNAVGSVASLVDMKPLVSLQGEPYTTAPVFPSGPPDEGSQGTVKNYHITQNIYTQEINPVKQAADLGWEVRTVM